MKSKSLSGKFALALLLLGSGGSVADAAVVAVTTTGTVTGATFLPANTTNAGEDAGNVFGLGTNIDGAGYTLTITYSPIGPNYFSTGSSAFDSFETSAPASIGLTINGRTMPQNLITSISSTLSESADPNTGLASLTGDLNGNPASGAFADASQSILSLANFIGIADLMHPYSYTLSGSDSGTDDVSITDANGNVIVDFSGTTSSVSFTVPEPASLGMLGSGLVGLAGLRRRRGHE